MEATRRLQEEPDQTGQESQSCSQKEVEEGWVEPEGRSPAAGGHTVEEEEGVIVGSLPSKKGLCTVRSFRMCFLICHYMD